MNEMMEILTIEFLRKHVDMFAWNQSNFKGIDPEVIAHILNVDPMETSVKQKKRSFGVERNRIIEEKVYKLLEAEACSKDPYPLPQIDLLVHFTARCELFSMIDAYQGHQQISCTTYKRLVNKIFKELIGTFMEVYVDDMLVKRKKENDNLSHLKQVFKQERDRSQFGEDQSDHATNISKNAEKSAEIGRSRGLSHNHKENWGFQKVSSALKTCVRDGDLEFFKLKILLSTLSDTLYLPATPPTLKPSSFPFWEEASLTSETLVIDCAS
ncbi:UNVERIFIED_CONTAM: hypothetical protein Scaly_1496600 [Sesamum calycinum]|uniref:Uncharacterized protein n=1 Tax=Sesamum calycinum TaxID=2727403 RepID=A0AAW2PQV6_9LAMI